MTCRGWLDDAEEQFVLADRDAISVAEDALLLELLSVDGEAVAAPEIHQHDLGRADPEGRVPSRHERVVEGELALLATPDDEIAGRQLDVVRTIAQPEVLHPSATLLQAHERFETFDAGDEEPLVRAERSRVFFH